MKENGIYIGVTDDGRELVFNPLLLNEEQTLRVCEATRLALEAKEN